MAVSSHCANFRKITAPATSGSACGSSAAFSNRFAVIRLVLLGIVEDYSQRVPLSGANAAYPMPKIHAIYATRTPHRTIVYGEDDAISLAQRNHLGTRLHAWSLLGHHELASMEVSPGFGEKYRELQRENMHSVEILMQTVVIAGFILQQQRSWLGLPGFVTASDKVGVLFRKVRLDSHCLVPAICDFYQMRIDR